MKAKTANFWQQLANQTIANKEQASEYLINQLGTPTSLEHQNLLSEILKRVNSYYFNIDPVNYTAYSLTGTIKTVKDILEKKFKEGKNKGQAYFILHITTEENQETIQVKQEDLEPSKWQQITKSALVGKNLVFKYKLWIKNKQLLDFYPAKKNSKRKKDE